MPDTPKSAEDKENSETFYFDLEKILKDLLLSLSSDNTINLVQNTISLVLSYLSSPLLNSAVTDNMAFSQVGKFLDPPDLILFFYLNKYLNSIAEQIIYSHYLPAPSSNNQIILPKETRVQTLITNLEPTIFNYITQGYIFGLGLLIKAKILNVNAEFLDQSLIVHAVISGNTKVVKFLLEQKAEIKKVSGLKEHDLEEHENLLTLAFKRGSVEIVKILLSLFEPIPIGLRSKSKSTLFLQTVDNGDIELAKSLVTSRADEVNPSDQSTLKSAIHQKNWMMTQLLLENGVKIESAKIESKTEDYYSPLLHFVQRCQATILSPNSAINLFHDVTKMLDLLLQYGDKIDVIKPSYIKELFLDEDHVLARIIISHGGRDDEINIFDIYIRISFIVNYSAQGNDWDSLIFWLNILRKKLSSDFDNQYSSLLEGAVNSFEGSVWLGTTDQDLSPQICKDKIFHLTKAIIIIAEHEAQNTKNWSTLKYFANELYCAAKEFILIKCNEYEKIYRSNRRSSDSDSKQTETHDEKNSTGTMPTQIDSESVSLISTGLSLFPLPPAGTNPNTENSSTIQSQNTNGSST